MTRAVVIGVGIVGASAAFHLAARGVETILIDRRDPGHATAAGAGIISPGTSTRPLPAYFPFAQVAVGYYPALLSQLAEVGQVDTGFDIVGELLLARSEEELAALSTLKALIEHRRDGGMPNVGTVSEVDDATARSMFPPLGSIRGALHVERVGRVDGDRMRNALAAAAVAKGARVEPGDVSLVVSGNRVTGVRVGTRVIEADAMVIAAGAWTNAILAPVGLSLPIEPQRGQILHITMGDTDTSRWPVLGGTGAQYTLAFGPNKVVSGATRETGSGYDVRMTVGGLQSVFNHALDVSPGLANGTVSEIRIGLRPLTADGLPYLDRVAGCENLVVAAGHGPSGLQLGPYSGLVAANLVTGEPVEADLAPFAIGRDLQGEAFPAY